MMDIFVVKNVVKPGLSTGSAQISAIYNNVGKDAFFLKSRVISDKTFGTTVPSASFRFVLTSIEDEKFMVSGGQSG